jgi:hypothetical protein
MTVGTDVGYIRTAHGLLALFVVILGILNLALVFYVYDDTQCIPDEPMLFPIAPGLIICSNGWRLKTRDGKCVLAWGLIIFFIELWTLLYFFINLCFMDFEIFRKKCWRLVSIIGLFVTGVFAFVGAIVGITPIVFREIQWHWWTEECISISLTDQSVVCYADKLALAGAAFALSCIYGTCLLMLAKTNFMAQRRSPTPTVNV